MDSIQPQIPGPNIDRIRQAVSQYTKLPEDRTEANNRIKDILSEVAATRLGSKKSRNSYELTFKVRHLSAAGEAPITSWITIRTHKQDLKASLRTMQAIRGLARNMTLVQFNQTFRSNRNVKLKVFE